jgi:O-antigen ligase
MNYNAAQNNANRSPWTPLGMLVNFAAFGYIVSAYTLMVFEGWSRIAFAFNAFLWIVLVADILISRGTVPRLLALPFMFCVFVAMSIGWAAEGDAAVDAAEMTLSTVFGGMAIWLGLSNRLSWKTLVWGSITGSMFLLISTRGELDVNRMSETRVSGLVGSTALPFFLCYTAFLVWCAPIKLPRWLHWVVWGFVVFSVLFTGTRKTMIFLGIAVLVTMLRFTRQLKHVRTWLMLAAGGAAALLVVGTGIVNIQKIDVVESIGSVGAVQRFLNTAMEIERDIGSGGIRRDMAEDAIDLWRRSPIIGQGAGQFSVLTQFGVYSHNNYSELLCNYGIIGFTLYFLLFFILLARALPGAVRGHQTQQIVVLLIVMMLMLDTGAISSLFKVSWIFIAAIAHLARIGQQESLQAVSNYSPKPRGILRRHA